MKPTKGICQKCGEERWLVNKSKGLCHKHNEQRKRDDKKKKLEAKGILETEAAIFRRIWETRDRVSFLSGRPVNKYPAGTTIWFSLFAHVLAKGKYPKMKYEEYNIILLTPDEHRLLDQGTEDQRRYYEEVTGAKWQKIYDLRDELKEKYKNL